MFKCFADVDDRNVVDHLRRVWSSTGAVRITKLSSNTSLSSHAGD